MNQQNNMYFLRSRCIIAHQTGNAKYKLDQPNNSNSTHYYVNSYNLRQKDSFNRKKNSSVKRITDSHFHIKKEYVVNVIFLSNQVFAKFATKLIAMNAETCHAQKKNSQSATNWDCLRITEELLAISVALLFVNLLIDMSILIDYVISISVLPVPKIYQKNTLYLPLNLHSKKKTIANKMNNKMLNRYLIDQYKVCKYPLT